MKRFVGIKQAVGEAQEWNKRNYNANFNIMVDYETKKVWCDCFTDCNGFKDYSESDEIQSVTVAMLFYLSANEPTMSNVKETISLMIDNNWPVERYRREVR